MSSKSFRDYQTSADEAIYQSLIVDGDSKCLVKMFCGTGKSLVMKKCKVVQNVPLCVYVFPSLGLIRQFNIEYLGDLSRDDLLNICSRKESEEEKEAREKQKIEKIPTTTEPSDIIEFLSSNSPNKIICVTYQSLKTLLDNLNGNRINICIFDEAHHAFGDEYQKLIFEHDVYDKQLFFTATPIPDKIEMYGKLVFEYTYLEGVARGIVNPFQIRVDMYTENTNKSIYESIARAILSSGNSRVLTFHKDVKTERDTSVRNFVDNELFNECFERVLNNEFPEKVGYYKSVYMVGLDADVKQDTKGNMLLNFDATPDNEVYVISSCKTIGEGIDTKNANMCVFADPKASVIEIIQNIGRIVRKLEGIDKLNSTILIPCWVDREKYVSCDGDREKCDAVIREDMSEGGNFNGILNVLSALKQEDEELYDACLMYPAVFAPRELDMNWSRQGLKLIDAVDEGEGELGPNLGYVLGEDVDIDDYDDCDNDEERIQHIAEDNDVCVEIHTNDLENPIQRYNEDCDDIVRLYREVDEETDTVKYQPIVSKESGETRSKKRGVSPDPKKRMGLNVHMNPDVKVLWGIVGEIDMNREICSCIIDCEVIRQDPMEVAEGIVERARMREANGGRLLPRQISRKKRSTLALEQEHKDAVKLGMWKYGLKRKGTVQYSANKVRDFLDENLHGWRTEIDFDVKAMEDAMVIVERAKIRESKGGILLPKRIRKKEDRITPELIQEHKDATRLNDWKKTNKKCQKNVYDYLSENLHGWNDKIDFEELAMIWAEKIVERVEIRKNDDKLKKENENRKDAWWLPRHKNKNIKIYDKARIQEDRDAKKLDRFRNISNGTAGRGMCPDSVKMYLDFKLPGWNKNTDEISLDTVKSIVERANIRKQNKKLEEENEKNATKRRVYWWIPRRIDVKENRTTPELEQEHADAVKLGNLRQAIRGSKNSKCSSDISNYLDENLQGWRKQEYMKQTREERNKYKNEWKKNNNNKTHDQQSPKIHTEITNTIKVLRKKPMNLVVSQPRPSEYTEQTQEQEKEKRRQRNKSALEELHQRYKTSNSSTLAHKFGANHQEWHDYHAISEANEETYSDSAKIPRNQIIAELEKIKSTREKHVVDLGCGKAHISKHFANMQSNQFRFTNYDFVACDETVSVGDISNLRDEIPDNSVDIAILSLAMWCKNREDNIKEAYRILDSQGRLYISEATKRWSEYNENGLVIAGREACELIDMLERNGFHIQKRVVEKFCMFVCTK